MKFPKLPKLFKKKYVVIYIIVFLLIASLFIFYFYGSFREKLTDAQKNLKPDDMKTNAELNTKDSEMLRNLIVNDIKAANIPVGQTLTGNILTKVQTEFDTITAEKLNNGDYAAAYSKNLNLSLDKRPNWASDVQKNYVQTKVPGCDITEEEKRKRKEKDPNYKIIPCPIKDASKTNPGTILPQYVH